MDKATHTNSNLLLHALQRLAGGWDGPASADNAQSSTAEVAKAGCGATAGDDSRDDANKSVVSRQVCSEYCSEMKRLMLYYPHNFFVVYTHIKLFVSLRYVLFSPIDETLQIIQLRHKSRSRTTLK